MERTESIIVQAAPDYENAKIKEMEAFGWNLQGRQEILEEGDAYGRPSFIDRTEYIIKIRVSHYVKLHFARSVDLPNLDRVKALEAQYFSLPFPNFPRLFPPGGVLGFVLFFFFWYWLWPLWYFRGYKRRKAAAEAELEATLRKQQEIVTAVAGLLKAA